MGLTGAGGVEVFKGLDYRGGRDVRNDAAEGTEFQARRAARVLQYGLHIDGADCEADERNITARVHHEEFFWAAWNDAHAFSRRSRGDYQARCSWIRARVGEAIRDQHHEFRHRRSDEPAYHGGGPATVG